MKNFKIINNKDASKMNRVLFIARVDPDEEDLKLTAKSILKSYCEEKEVFERPKYIDIVEDLASSYFKFKEN